MSNGRIVSCTHGKDKSRKLSALHRGIQGEQYAAAFLVRKGLEIIVRNYRCRRGEVDLIARDGDVLVFVEVRWRTGNLYGGAENSIDFYKQRRLIAAARHYLGCREDVPACRFDAILIEGKAGTLRWLQDIFWL